MIGDERLNDYINSLYVPNTDYLNSLEEQAHRDYVPVIRKDVQNLLKYLLSCHKPARILEVGTAIGFSAILMAEYNPVPCEIITIENYAKRIPIARNNFDESGYGEIITLLEGDAHDILKQLDDGFDFIFMDAAKGQYLNFLPDIMRLLKPKAVLVTDNALQDGNVKESRYAIGRRDRTIHGRMREYLYTLTHLEELSTVVLPIGDGITISYKKEETHE